MKHINNVIQYIWAMIKRKWWIFFIIFLIAGYFVYKSQFTHAQINEDRTYTLTRQTLKDTLSLSGEIDAEEHVVVSFAQGGRLTWVGVKEGDQVKKYQGLASLDQRQLEKDIKKTLNNYLSTRSTFDQTQDTNDEYHLQPESEDGDRMKRLIDIAQNNLDNAVLDVEIKTIAKEDAFLYTPIDGIVIQAQYPYPGVHVTTSSVKFEIVNPQTLYFSASADQVDVVKLKEGMTGDITFDSFVDEQVTGTIQKISFTPMAGELGTAYEVTIAFPFSGAETYRIGMTGDISFTLKELSDALFIPSDYLQIEKDGTNYVMKVTKENGKKKLVKTPITIKEEYEGNIHIANGLKEGDVIYETE